MVDAHGGPTVLAGGMQEVQHKGKTTQAYPMQWIKKGISSKSRNRDFLAALQEHRDASAIPRRANRGTVASGSSARTCVISLCFESAVYIESLIPIITKRPAIRTGLGMPCAYSPGGRAGAPQKLTV
jgi:hypothetical protein